VTRPQLQAEPLCRQLEAQGALPERLPAIEIRAVARRDELAATIGELQRYALIVFVSANAVRFGATLLGERRDLCLAAIGPATLRALNQAGHRVAIVPDGGFDTEALLRHPRLQNLTGQRVLLIKGDGGRELLEAELGRRGALVTTACVYARQRTTLDAAQAEALAMGCNDGALAVITATSAEIGLSLLAMAAAHPSLRDGFGRCHWLVPGLRVATELQAHGLTAPLLVAASAEDQSLIDELLRWRTSASGA
jgi:uroporphyrinogen-III synthase